jgi:Fur family ferric uptake transcriptional regulator
MSHHCHIEKTLKAGGLRQTKKRHRLLAYFQEKRAWSAAELHHRLGGGHLSTIYRNIHDLLKNGIISEVQLRGEEARYELAQAPHHAHLVCRRCSRAECVPCPVRTQTDHSLEMRGLCSLCQ